MIRRTVVISGLAVAVLAAHIAAKAQRDVRVYRIGWLSPTTGPRPTFREAHDKNNSLQNPHLPDWALIDVTTPPNDQWPGKIVDADFFDEHWKVKETKGKEGK